MYVILKHKPQYNHVNGGIEGGNEMILPQY